MIEVEFTEKELFFLQRAASNFKKGSRREFCGSGLSKRLHEHLVDEIGIENERELRTEWKEAKEHVSDDNSCPECNQPRS